MTFAVSLGLTQDERPRNAVLSDLKFNMDFFGLPHIFDVKLGIVSLPTPKLVRILSDV